MDRLRVTAAFVFLIVFLRPTAHDRDRQRLPHDLLLRS
jgi:hypothetical protein